ncbi:CKLF-like MARVEL transmembrane domain-containing protein 5 [Diadema setosum]|uniref:CKLF-like MARVEL transmembrane domain-containing protein 5 n=1 Tax=Diadema setosum TaxID=31175 RepID=UPI003B3BE9D4
MADQVGEAGNASSGSPDKGRKCGFDMNYVSSIHGILKAKQMGWSFLAFFLICFAASGAVSVLFLLVTLAGFLTSTVIFFMFGTDNYKKVTKVNWFLADVLHCLAAIVLYIALGIPLIISILCPLCIASAVFGFIAVASYGAGIWYSIKRWRENKTRQTSNAQYNVDY